MTSGSNVATLAEVSRTEKINVATLKSNVTTSNFGVATSEFSCNIEDPILCRDISGGIGTIS